MRVIRFFRPTGHCPKLVLFLLSECGKSSGISGQWRQKKEEKLPLRSRMVDIPEGAGKCFLFV